MFANIFFLSSVSRNYINFSFCLEYLRGGFCTAIDCKISQSATPSSGRQHIIARRQIARVVPCTCLFLNERFVKTIPQNKRLKTRKKLSPRINVVLFTLLPFESIIHTSLFNIFIGKHMTHFTRHTLK